MIELWVGEDDFEIWRELTEVRRQNQGKVRTYQADPELLDQFDQIFFGVSLFDDNQILILDNWSINKDLFEKFSEIVDDIDDTKRVICVENKPDKRLKAYKNIKKVAQERIFDIWNTKNNRVTKDMISWAEEWAEKFGISINLTLMTHLIVRLEFNKGQIWRALERFSFLDQPISEDDIEVHLPKKLEVNSFEILEKAATGGDFMLDIQNLKAKEDPYYFMGLLSSQALMVAFADSVPDNENISEYASQLGVHPYALSSAGRLSKKIGSKRSLGMVKIFADAGSDIKGGSVKSSSDPWLAIELALYKVSNIGK